MFLLKTLQFLVHFSESLVTESKIDFYTKTSYDKNVILEVLQVN